MADIIGIGNPLLDSTINVDDSFLEKHGLAKSNMFLVSKEKQVLLLNDLDSNNLISTPGGSVANMLAAANALGSSTSFIGTIGNDVYGTLYEELLLKNGVGSSLLKSDNLQGSCLVLITPDGERTFATFLGAALNLDDSLIDKESFSNAKFLYIEGYQLDGENNLLAVKKAISIAKELGVKIAIDLADPGVVSRHKSVLSLLLNDADIIFANENEASLFTGENDLSLAAKKLSLFDSIVIVKNGALGSLVCEHDVVINIPSFEVDVVNTNGAGDAYAGAFIQSYISGKSLEESGLIASKVASVAVSQEASMLNKDLLKDLSFD